METETDSETKKDSKLRTFFIGIHDSHMNGIQAYSNCVALETNEMLLFYTHKHTHGGCNAMCNASIGNSMFDFLKKCYSKTYFRLFILSAYFSHFAHTLTIWNLGKFFSF